MRRRGLASPDNGDALAICFSYPVMASAASRARRSGRLHRADYDAYAWDSTDKDDGEMSPRQHEEILRGRAMGLRE
jgi:hypothetical protein